VRRPSHKGCPWQGAGYSRCCGSQSREGVINTESLLPEQASAVVSVARRMPRLTGGTELIGEYRGSGFQEQKFIVRRIDGQVIQLPRLLYLLAANLDGTRNLEQIAATLSDEHDRVLRADQVAFLIDQRLRPAGLVADDSPAGAIAPPAKMIVKPDPLLALRFRVGVVPEQVVWRIAGLFQPMFWLPVIISLLATLIALDVTIVARGGTSQIVPSALALVSQPGLTLLVIGMIVAAAVFQECGHVTGCRYGGARPGKMGVGLYLVWPAFYSTVTDSYRLDRAGRLRTDLGGVYFNAVFITALNIAYLNSASQWLLVTIVFLHFETATQFLPMIRLDGYYILSDLIGVPDLFSRMGPALMSMIPGRPTHPRVLELKRWVRYAITLWVLLVVPCLLYWVVTFVMVAPQVFPAVLHRVGELGHTVATLATAGHVAATTVGVIQILLLLLPWAGSLLLLGMIVHDPLRWALSRWPAARVQAGRSSC
jgi:putative peptide zinc metalloprotease protein